MSLLVQHLPPRYLTANLHTCVMHLRQQEHRFGPMALFADWWIERALQQHKQVVHGRISREPERLMANAMLARRGLTRAAAAGAGRTFDQWLPEYRSKELVGPQYDAGCPETGVQLMHASKQLTGRGNSQATWEAAQQRRKAAEAAAHRFIQHHRPAGWQADSVVAAPIWEHSAATRSGREVVSSMAHSRALRSQGFHI